MAKKTSRNTDKKPASKTVVNPELEGAAGETVLNPELEGVAGKTVPNPELEGAADVTVPNPELEGAAGVTVPNPELKSVAGEPETDPDAEDLQTPVSRESPTELNPMVQDSAYRGSLGVGELLFQKYTVTKWLSTSGEADIYLCEAEDGAVFVAKHYRREQAIKPEVLEALRGIDSPYIMPIYDYGVYKGYPLEIGKYYPDGSLQDQLDSGKRYTYEEIKRDILPTLNKALHQLHQNGILHRDIKPANIMLLPDGAGVALIDFGISAYLDKGESITIEDIGITPIYIAPEQFPGIDLCYPGSDYYSVGIVLYALFCGAPPSADCPTIADIRRDRTSNGIIFPDGMPDEFRKLLDSLTYPIITKRTDSDESHRRWVYEEVERFLAGEAVRASGSSDRDYSDAIKPYLFNGGEYTTVSSLVNAMGEHWQQAIDEIRYSRLSDFFTNVDDYPKLANICKQEEDNYRKNQANADLVLWALLCRLNPKSEIFFWQGRKYERYQVLGEDMLDRLIANDSSDYSKWDAILEQGLLSAFLTRKESEKKGEAAEQIAKLCETIRFIESDHREKLNGDRGKLLRYHQVAYILSGRGFAVTYKDGDKEASEEFHEIESLAGYMKALYERGFDTLASFCQRLFNKKGEIDLRLEAWLLAKGKADALTAFSNASKT